jgi:hypothetical protein
MKNKSNKSSRIFPVLVLFISAGIFGSCNNNDPDEGIDTPISVTKVYLEDVNSSVPDREVVFARLGQTLRLEGSGFIGIKKIIINGYNTYFNPVFISDNSMLVTISRDTPTTDAPDDVRNTIRLEKSANNFKTHTFEIRSAAPSITRVSHTMPQAGELITLFGSGLQEVSRVTFPGGVIVDEGIESDDDEGKWCTVTVPQGVSDEGGSIFAESANGGAYSPGYFNFKKGLLHDFDGVKNEAWSNGEISDDLSEVIPSGGNLPKSQGIYRSLNKDAKTLAANDVPVDATRYWIKNSVWADVVTTAAIPLSTSAAECGIQMDIYFENEWKSGDIRFVVADGWGATRYCMVYAPWAEGGVRTEVENPGCWFTITLPFADSDDFDGLTLAEVLAQIAAASYDQAGPWFENGTINGVESQPTNLNVYFDNIRIVPLTAPEYSDYPSDSEE